MSCPLDAGPRYVLLNDYTTIHERPCPKHATTHKWIAPSSQVGHTALTKWCSRNPGSRLRHRHGRRRPAPPPPTAAPPAASPPLPCRGAARGPRANRPPPAHTFRHSAPASALAGSRPPPVCHVWMDGDKECMFLCAASTHTYRHKPYACVAGMHAGKGINE